MMLGGIPLCFHGARLSPRDAPSRLAVARPSLAHVTFRLERMRLSLAEAVSWFDGTRTSPIDAQVFVDCARSSLVRGRTSFHRARLSPGRSWASLIRARLSPSRAPPTESAARLPFNALKILDKPPVVHRIPPSLYDARMRPIFKAALASAPLLKTKPPRFRAYDASCARRDPVGGPRQSPKGDDVNANGRRHGMVSFGHLGRRLHWIATGIAGAAGRPRARGSRARANHIIEQAPLVIRSTCARTAVRGASMSAGFFAVSVRRAPPGMSSASRVAREPQPAGSQDLPAGSARGL